MTTWDCSHELCMSEREGRRSAEDFTAAETRAITSCMVEQGALIWVGLDQDGEPYFAMPQE